jgi:drug/metabolite transporter superfamily protein YnfA
MHASCSCKTPDAHCSLQWSRIDAPWYERAMIRTLATLLTAALLEVGGDAAIRWGLVRSAPAALAAGAVGLAVYGFVVNANRAVDFGRLMGAYIAVFFVVSQAVGVVAFGERPAGTLLVGGALVVAGGLVIQLGAR